MPVHLRGLQTFVAASWFERTPLLYSWQLGTLQLGWTLSSLHDYGFRLDPSTCTHGLRWMADAELFRHVNSDQHRHRSRYRLQSLQRWTVCTNRLLSDAFCPFSGFLPWAAGNILYSSFRSEFMQSVSVWEGGVLRCFISCYQISIYIYIYISAALLGVEAVLSQLEIESPKSVVV